MTSSHPLCLLPSLPCLPCLFSSCSSCYSPPLFTWPTSDLSNYHKIWLPKADRTLAMRLICLAVLPGRSSTVWKVRAGWAAVGSCCFNCWAFEYVRAKLQHVETGAQFYWHFCGFGTHPVDLKLKGEVDRQVREAVWWRWSLYKRDTISRCCCL